MWSFAIDLVRAERQLGHGRVIRLPDEALDVVEIEIIGTSMCPNTG